MSDSFLFFFFLWGDFLSTLCLIEYSRIVPNLLLNFILFKSEKSCAWKDLIQEKETMKMELQSFHQTLFPADLRSRAFLFALSTP